MGVLICFLKSAISLSQFLLVKKISLQSKIKKYENIVETRHIEDDCLPLCFPSFEWLKKRPKVSDHKHKFDIVDECINFLGMDDE